MMLPLIPVAVLVFPPRVPRSWICHTCSGATEGGPAAAFAGDADVTAPHTRQLVASTAPAALAAHRPLQIFVAMYMAPPPLECRKSTATIAVALHAETGALG